MSTVKPAADIEPEVAAIASERTLRSRLFQSRSVLSFLLALGILLFFGSRLDIDPARTWETIRSANPLMVALGFALYYSTFPLRGLRWRLLLKNALGKDKAGTVPGVPALAEIIYISWFVNCVIPAKLGDAYRGYRLKQETGASFSATMGTVLAERFFDVVVLVALLVGATITTGGFGFGDTISTQIVEGGLALLVVGCTGLGAMWLLRERLHLMLPARLRAVYLRFQQGTLSSFSNIPLLLLLSVAVWITEVGRLFLVMQALGLPLSFPYAVFLSLANALLTVVPFTPGGLGLVETGIVGLLLLTGVSKELAVATALIDRTISYWSIVIFGFVLFVLRRKV